MKIIKMALALCLIMALVVIQHNDAFAQCKAKEGCSAEDDTGPNPLCESGTYNPCDSWMLWDVYFTRTQQLNQTTVQYLVVNAGWVKNYSTLIHQDPGDYHFSGTHYVGSSANHNVQIRRTYGPSGGFTDLSLQVEYVANKPD